MPSTILGPRDAVMNQTDKGPVHIFVVPVMIYFLLFSQDVRELAERGLCLI